MGPSSVSPANLLPNGRAYHPGSLAVDSACGEGTVGRDARREETGVSQHAKAATVTIIGAGLGGIALVANLGLKGYRLRLHDRDEARIAKARERGGLDVEGLVHGF